MRLKLCHSILIPQRRMLSLEHYSPSSQKGLVKIEALQSKAVISRKNMIFVKKLIQF